MKRLMILRQILAAFLLLGWTQAAHAQDNQSFAPPVVIELSLDEVTDLALANSLDIQIAKYNAYIERTSLEKEESLFDTYFNAEASFSRDRGEQASSLAAAEEKKHALTAGLEKKLPTGTTLELDLTDEKVRTESPFATLNPYNEASVKLAVTQELGKNFFGLADRSNIKITKLDIENADFTSLDDIEDAISEVQRSYWKIALKEAQLAIAWDMLKKARQLYRIYQDKYSLGTAEESELLAIQALAIARESEVFIIEMERDAAKNDLLFLINKGDFEQDIRAKDALTCSAKSVYLYEALTEAVENRRDHRRFKNKLKSKNIDIVIKENALWPEIDLEASFARNNIDISRSDAWGELANSSNDDISVKIKFEIPLENRGARSALKKSRLEKLKSLVELKRSERLILREINDRVNRLNTIGNQVELFEEMVKVHTEKLQEQVKRLNYGRSDSDTLIRYEEDLLQARRSLANYQFDYRVSLIELDSAKDSLLAKYWKGPL
ncbi:TolC family protein [Candidatus Omnitrophota bacterium]